MNYYSFAVELLQQKEYFKQEVITKDRVRFIFCGQAGLTASEHYYFVSLIYRKLGGEQYPKEIKALTLYYEFYNEFCYMGLYHVLNKMCINRFCLTSTDYLKTKNIDIFTRFVIRLN